MSAIPLPQMVETVVQRVVGRPFLHCVASDLALLEAHLRRVRGGGLAGPLELGGEPESTGRGAQVDRAASDQRAYLPWEP